jgi:hypothetical protein
MSSNTMKKWTDQEQIKFLGGFVVGVVFTGVCLTVAFYSGIGRGIT